MDETPMVRNAEEAMRLTMQRRGLNGQESIDNALRRIAELASAGECKAKMEKLQLHHGDEVEAALIADALILSGFTVIYEGMSCPIGRTKYLYSFVYWL